MLFASTSDQQPSTSDFLDVSTIHVQRPTLISDEIRLIFQWVMYTVVITLLSTFGIVTNIINIICFARQGLKDPVNVSLLGLAVSDLGCLLTSLVMGVGYGPALNTADLPFDPQELLYLAMAWPHVILTSLTSWLTALITLERCLCITMPLKVKSIVTPKRVTITIVCLFALLVCSVSPVYYANRLAKVFSPERNRTLLRLVYTNDKATVEQIYFAINNAIIPFSAYMTIIVCTVTLALKLHNKAKWRQTCTMAEMISERDQRVAKMVVMVSTLFIVCFSPLCVSFTAMFLVPELAVDGPYRNMLYVIGSVSILLESTNSSANIFIYYRMSHRYRAVFHKLFVWAST